MPRSFEDDLRDARLERLVELMDSVVKDRGGVADEPITGGLRLQRCPKLMNPCPPTECRCWNLIGEMTERLEDFTKIAEAVKTPPVNPESVKMLDTLHESMFAEFRPRIEALDSRR